MSIDRKVQLTDYVALLINNVKSRTLGLVLGLDDDFVTVDRKIIACLNLIGNAGNHVLEADFTRMLYYGYSVIRIPFTYSVAFDNFVPVSLVEYRTVRDIVLREGNAGVLVYDAKLGCTAYYNILDTTVTICSQYGTKFVELKLTVVLGIYRRIRSRARCSTTDVEGTERKLGTRLTDRLSGDNSDNFSLFNHSAGCKVATVTLGADALAALASED